MGVSYKPACCCYINNKREEAKLTLRLRSRLVSFPMLPLERGEVDQVLYMIRFLCLIRLPFLFGLWFESLLLFRTL